MVCKSIDYLNFRNITSVHIDFHDGINVLCGDNAEGKTNALEGIYIFASGRSFRTHSDSDLIRFGEKCSKIKLVYSDSTTTNTLEFVTNTNKQRICKKNFVSLKKLSEFVGNFQAVLFCPEHLSIVKNGPSERRFFLDSALSQISPVYLGTLQRYHNILRQRNALLKKKMFSGGDIDNIFREELEIWSDQLAEEAKYISEARYKYIELLGKKTAEHLLCMTSGKESVSLSYDEPISKEKYLVKLRSNIEREVKNGMTLFGIHRDDMTIQISGKDARLFASQGQQRSSALSMKLAEGDIIYERRGEYPVFLLDDILSELDEKRKSYILEGLKDRQVIITSCENNISGDRIFSVKNGNYTVI